MLQELLHSILVQNAALVQYVYSVYSTLRTEQKSRGIEWNLESLRVAITNVLGLSTCKANLCLFLDALDEHAGENEELVRLVWDMARTARENAKFVRLKICIASRPWGIFEKSFGQCPQFAIHEHTQGDIEMYTAQRIREAMYTPQSSPAEAAIVESIVRGALGVFIWVRLVLDRITQDIVDGTPFPKLHRTIAQLPSELGELYRLTVQRIKPQYHPETWVMFQAVLGAIHPLPLAELLSITDTHSLMDLTSIADMSILPSFKTDGPESDNMTGSIPKASDSAIQERLRWLNSRSGGLLEVTAVSSFHPSIGQLGPRKPGDEVSRTGYNNQSDASAIAIVNPDPPESITTLEGSQDDVADGEGYYVQFIHQTVKDSLINHGLNLGFDVDHDGIDTSIYQLIGYEILLKACHRSSPSIWTDALVYAKLAEASVQGQQERLKAVAASTQRVLEQLDEADIASMLNLIEFNMWMKEISNYTDKHVQYVRTLLLAISANLHLFIKVWLGEIPNEVRIDILQRSALLSFAVICPIVEHSESYQVQRIKMVETLIGHGCDCNEDSYLPREIFLDEALGSTGYGQFLADATATMSPLTALCFFGRQRGNEIESVFDIANALIKYGASVDTGVYLLSCPYAEITHASILEHSVRYGSAEWVRFILSHGATETSTESGYSLAEYAHLRHDAEIIRFLKDHGLYDPQQRILDGVAEFPTCGHAIRMTSEMLMSTSGGCGADLKPKQLYLTQEQARRAILQGELPPSALPPQRPKYHIASAHNPP